MANVCCTDVVIYPYNEAGLPELRTLSSTLLDLWAKRIARKAHMEAWAKTNGTKPKFISTGIPLRDVLTEHGCSDDTGYDCRGDIVDFEFVQSDDEEADVRRKCYIQISQDDAWEPQLGCWDYLLQNVYPNLAYVYVAEELNDDILVNSDMESLFFPQRFRFDYAPDKEPGKFGAGDLEFYSTLDEALSALGTRTGQAFASLEEAQEWLEENVDENDYVSLYAYEMV